MNHDELATIEYEIRQYRRNNNTTKPKSQEAVAHMRGYKNYLHMVNTIKGRNTGSDFIIIWVDDTTGKVHCNFKLFDFHYNEGITLLNEGGMGNRETERQIALNLFPHHISNDSIQPVAPYQILSSLAINDEGISIIPMDALSNAFAEPFDAQWRKHINLSCAFPDKVRRTLRRISVGKWDHPVVHPSTAQSLTSFLNKVIDQKYCRETLKEACESMSELHTPFYQALANNDQKFFSQAAQRLCLFHAQSSIFGWADIYCYETDGKMYYHDSHQAGGYTEAANALLRQLHGV